MCLSLEHPAQRYSFISCQTCLDGSPPSELSMFWSLNTNPADCDTKWDHSPRGISLQGFCPSCNSLFRVFVDKAWHRKQSYWSVPFLQQRGLCVPTCKIIPQLQCVKCAWWLPVTLLSLSFDFFPSWDVTKTDFKVERGKRREHWQVVCSKFVGR